MPPAGNLRFGRAAAAPSASATTTITSTGHQSEGLRLPATGTLRLRGEEITRESRAPERHIRWAEDVVNNEGMGKKSSKVCCIYHKPREVGESSSEESSSDSSSDEDSDSGNDDGAARPAPSMRQGRGHQHDHNAHGHEGSSSKGKARRPSPNAYEKQPKSVTNKQALKT